MRKRFLNLKFQFKILIGMAFITTLALVMISLFDYRQFYQRNMQDARSKAAQSVNTVAHENDSQFHSLILNASKFLLIQPLDQLMPQVLEGRKIDLSRYYSSYGQAFDSFVQNNRLLSGAFLYGRNRTFLSTLSAGIRQNPSTMFPEGLCNAKKVTILPVRKDLITNYGDVIPIVMPLQQTSTVWSAVSSSQPVEFVMLINAARLNRSISYCSGSYTYSLYLTDSNGTPLTLSEENCPEAFEESVENHVEETDGFTETTVRSGSDFLYLTIETLDTCGIKAVHIFRESTLLASEKEMKSFFVFTWLICLIICGILCVLLSDFLIRPLKSLTDVVSQIKSGTYRRKKQFRYKDEIGVLGTQINSMYDTIQSQILKIKTEEQKKARAEVRLLSEQMNPHFLYNTLECIRFQVLNQHNEDASAMLESLGKYLRLTLSSGDAFVSVRQELTHVTEYMALMNRHSKNGIQLHCQAEPQLMDHTILKMILQPLAENCIKHGFPGGPFSDPCVSPEINISIRQIQDKIEVTVEDNGKGIDIEKASACLLPSEHSGKKHFGLHNIYRRLCSYYGEASVSISFTSIPHFRNTVTILFPNSENHQSNPHP
jgi:sensor histidine kinase YesM